MQTVESRQVVMCDVVTGATMGPSRNAVPGSTPAPRRLGSGIITGVLGEGGMAVVYEIWNERLGLKRAVKVLRPDYTAENRGRFDTEIKVTAQLDHPNIIRIHSVGEENGLPYIEMEKVDGFSLAALIARRGALPLDVSLATALVVSRALNYTHTHRYTSGDREVVGVLHRDMKPENILIAHDGKVRLTDFGIATPVNVSLHTPDGNIVGSLQYIAPEQLKGEEVDSRADVYSFGCVLYEMLTGFKAFPDRKIADLIPKRLGNSFDPLSSYHLAIPTPLKRLVRRCMSSDRSRRPRSMAAISNELARMLASCTDLPAHKIVARFMESDQARTRFVKLRPRTTPLRSALLAAASVILGGGVLVLGARFPAFLSGVQANAGTLFSSSEVQASLVSVTVPAAGGEVGKPGGFVDSLRAYHGFNDLLSIMRVEDQHKQYATVLALREHLGATQATSRLGVLLVMRALDRTGTLSLDFFTRYPVQDAEFFLTRAGYQYRRGDYAGTLASLERVGRQGAYLEDDRQIQQQSLVLRARALTKAFYQLPDSNVQQQALAAWRSVRHAYRTRTSSSVYREAVREADRLEKI